MKRCLVLLLTICFALSALPAMAQVVLVGNFGQEAEMLSYGEAGGGAYSQSLLVDAGVMITTGREAIEAGVNDSLDAVIASAYPDAYDILVIEMPPVAGYPAERIRFYQGDNADTHVVDYVYIPTEDWIFSAEISVPADWHEDYADLVDSWVASIDLFDDGLSGEDGTDPDLQTAAAGSPLAWNDLSTYVILTDEDDTVNDLVEMFSPTLYTWKRDAESGQTALTFTCDDGLLTIVPDSSEGLDPEQGEAGAADLPDGVLASGCSFLEAQWLGPDFLLYPLRDLGIGGSMADVLLAYAGGERQAADDPEYDEMIVYTVTAEAPERGQATLAYYGREGAIARIRLLWLDESAE